MEKVFVDTNIVLDWLGQRQPFYQYAKSLFFKAEQGEIEILLSTMTYISSEYILRKQVGKERAKQALAAVRKISKVCDSGGKEINLALLSTMKDFEDSFQYFSALNNGANIIITRNPKDFKNSKLPIMSAEEYLKSK